MRQTISLALFLTIGCSETVSGMTAAATTSTTVATSGEGADSRTVGGGDAETTVTMDTDYAETGNGTGCDGIECGPNGTCETTPNGPICDCADGHVLVEDACVSTDVWKLEAGHFISPKMPMTVVHPRPDGETQTWARNRVAHPDFRYEIPIGVQGGAWPFFYELLDGPETAKIGQILGQQDYGVVTWDPQPSGTFTFTVRVTDQSLQSVTATWTVTVDPAPFVFIDGDMGDDGGTGTIGDPLRTFAGWYRDDVDDASWAGRVLVFRESTTPYVMSGDPVQTNGNCRINSDTKPVVWIGYPDEQPVLDASASKVFVEAPRADLYIAGLRFEHARQDVENAHFFWVSASGDRITFWRNTFYDLGPGMVGNDNTGPVFVSGTDGEKRYILAKENLYEEIDNLGFNGHLFEVYQSSFVLYEQEVARNTATPAGWFPKGAIANVTVRNNTAIDGVDGIFIEGSLGGEAGQLPHDHEFCWNNVRVGSGDGFLLSNSAFYEGAHYGGSVYRNTFVGGSPVLRFAGAEPYETDGNVVITEDATRFGLDISVHQEQEDLIAAPGDGVVDEENRLTGEARAAYLGVRGYEVH